MTPVARTGEGQGEPITHESEIPPQIHLPTDPDRHCVLKFLDLAEEVRLVKDQHEDTFTMELAGMYRVIDLARVIKDNVAPPLKWWPNQ